MALAWSLDEDEEFWFPKHVRSQFLHALTQT